MPGRWRTEISGTCSLRFWLGVSNFRFYFSRNSAVKRGVWWPAEGVPEKRVSFVTRTGRSGRPRDRHSNERTIDRLIDRSRNCHSGEGRLSSREISSNYRPWIDIASLALAWSGHRLPKTSRRLVSIFVNRNHVPSSSPCPGRICGGTYQLC